MSRKRRKQKFDETPITTTIEKLSHDGRGIAYIDGKVTFIQNALPGEKVIFQYRAKHSSFDEGNTLEVIQPSSQRVEPPCPYYHMCGGCSLQHLSTSHQIEHKQAVLLEQLLAFGQVSPLTIEPPLQGLSLGYRRKARLGVRFVENKNQLLIGFRERNGRFITQMDTCAILYPSIGLKIADLKILITSLSIMKQIPQIEIAVGDNQTALVIRHLAPLNEEDLRKLTIFSKENHLDTYLQPKGIDSIHKIWPADHKNYLNYRLSDEKITMQFHPCDFTQINSEINRQMIEQAITWLDIQPEDVVLDLFCGIGNFTLPLATLAKIVTGIEGEPVMVNRAKENAELNKLCNTQFFTTNLFEPDNTQQWMPQKYDKILLDPPRSGAINIVKDLNRFEAKRIVYVSCNPATLARDAHIMTHQHHYTLEKVSAIDMFPHTTHVETMALFVKT